MDGRLHIRLTSTHDHPAAGRELKVEWRPDWWPITLVAVAILDGRLVQLCDVPAAIASRLEWALYERHRGNGDPGHWVMADTGHRFTPHLTDEEATGDH